MIDKETKVLKQWRQAIKDESDHQGPMLKHFFGMEFMPWKNRPTCSQLDRTQYSGHFCNNCVRT